MHSAPLRVESVAAGPGGRSLRRDLATGLLEQVFDWDLGSSQRLVDIDLETSDASHTVYAIREDDPLSALPASTRPRGAHLRAQLGAPLPAGSGLSVGLAP